MKSMDAGRMIVTDHIVGRLGHAVSAAVGAPTLVDVPADLIAAEAQMAHMTAGVAHGSRWIPDCSQGGIEHVVVPENRDRFARLALLYGWVVAADRQFIYQNQDPRLVHSVDHGHFFARLDGLDRRYAQPRATRRTRCTHRRYLWPDMRRARRRSRGDDEGVRQHDRRSRRCPSRYLGYQPERTGRGSELHRHSKRRSLHRARGGQDLTSRYVVFQYDPDPGAGERINIGVATHGDAGTFAGSCGTGVECRPLQIKTSSSCATSKAV